MTKTKLPKEVDAEVKKLTAEELQKLVEVQQKINSITLNLGNAELAKQAMISQYSEVRVEWEGIAKNLEDKYGQVNVNLADGTISPMEPVGNPLG